MNATLKYRLGLVCFASAAILAVAAGYAPGLQGTFLFDDAANLPALGAYGPIDNSATLLRYLTSGHADPTGRPLSMLSFLLDARNWPADPATFKRTNLGLHLVNALLLGTVLAWLGRLQGLPLRRADASALIAATLWALHPFFVSTVLYIVQREAMLPATFTLLAILCWLKARVYAPEKLTASVLWLVLGVGACTALAALSKANGLLIPLLVMACEATLPTAGSSFRKALNWTLGPPALAVVGWVVWSAIRAIGDGPIPIRGWSVWQRLITEPTILLDYLAQLWLFKPTDSSLLHDDVRAAVSLWNPWYTLPSLLACTALIACAWTLRRRYPFATLAILFFFAGHLMESTSLALELYFDHRNYLPAMPMFWPVAVALTGMPRRRIAGAMTMLGFFALFALTHSSTTMWGEPVTQATEWAERHPESARAQAYAAQIDMGAGRQSLARTRIESARARFTGEPQIALNMIDIHCATGGLEPGDLAYTRDSFREAQREPGPLLLNWFARVIDSGKDRYCRGLTDEALASILAAAEENPRIAAIPGRRQDVDHVQGLIFLANGDAASALTRFNEALAEDPNPGAALEQAALLGSAGAPALGLAHLAYFSRMPAQRRHPMADGMPWLHDRILDNQGYWRGEIAHLSDALRRAAATPP